MGQVIYPASIRKIRQELGLGGAQFASVLGVHPTTVSRWENSTEPVVVEGMAWTVLAGLEQRLASERKASQAAKDAGKEIQTALLVGGALIALAILIDFAAKKR
ncbi:MAG: helix-turn-helix domain-containing protein [Phycisphaerales bacterium]|jgi:transcriptional regulator with XRE-family HTH domain|nr:helix-turn-helix domain-containing protein [Phycisphaerales bacterium]